MTWFQGLLASGVLQTNDFSGSLSLSIQVSPRQAAHLESPTRRFCILASECSGLDHLLCAPALWAGPGLRLQAFTPYPSLTMHMTGLAETGLLSLPGASSCQCPSVSPLRLRTRPECSSHLRLLSRAWKWASLGCRRRNGLQGRSAIPASFCITVCPPEPQTIDLEFSCLEKGVDDLINSQRLFHMKKPQGF